MAVSSLFYTATVTMTAGTKSVAKVTGAAWDTILQPGHLGFAIRTGAAAIPIAVDVVTSATVLQLTDNWSGTSGGATLTVLLLPTEPAQLMAAMQELNELLSFAGAIITTDDYTAADVLAKLLTVDSDTAGINATTLKSVTPGAFGLALLDDPTATAALTTLGFSTYAKSLIDDADAATARATLGANDAGNLTTGTLGDARVSATLTADKAFRRGNILGTVSQTSGVPTGALIETGATASGEYVRYAGGTQICTRLVALEIGSTAVQTWGCAASFLNGDAAASVSAAVFNSFGGGTAVDAMNAMKALPLLFDANNWQLRFPSPAPAASGTLDIRLTAIGRWY